LRRELRLTSRRARAQAIDPIPVGTELLMSYFQVTLPRAHRQARLLTDYGFVCACQRCQLEAAGARSCGASAMDADGSDDGEEWEQGGQGYTPEYALWFLKNVCPRSGCGGTLAPPSTVADVMECNFCGHLRTDAAFYADLESGT